MSFSGYMFEFQNDSGGRNWNLNSLVPRIAF
jgi:hypothetical protein